MGVSLSARRERNPAAGIVIRRISPADLVAALRDGFDDFRQVPTQLAFICVIYPVVAILAAKLTAGYRVLPLFYPMATGFALVGPVAALGMYEISRRRERNLPVSWRDAFAVLRSNSLPHIIQMALVLLVIFMLWMVVARSTYTALFDEDSMNSMSEMLYQMVSGAGIALIVLGNFMGLLFAILTLSISVVSFPMILDRNVDVATAIRTSLAAMARNPATMLLWGLIVAVLLLLGGLLLFVGLAVVIPVLGHATWHLYRRLIEAPPIPVRRP
ncbi:DUF2189 domain-containing protein [Lichenicoccus sp.]|uniref:DUF2189 domain-containing protein n=1 Tax=Lichenicoccus sp. TaxID=2781899 RepID=UPI003D140209